MNTGIVNSYRQLFKLYIKKFSIAEEIKKFNHKLPIEEAFTPPSSWYTDPVFYKEEIQKVFKKNWVAVSSDSKLKEINNYTSGEIFGQPYIIVNKENQLKAYYNVCSHHASKIVTGCGKKDQLECPYHGWTYNLDGNLIKCTSMKGMKNFSLKSNGLKPIKIQQYGNLVFLNFSKEETTSLEEIIKPLENKLKEFNYNSTFSDLEFVKSKVYHLDCNWKIFIDNYCDGGYHVPYGHKQLSSNLKLDAYKIDVYDKISLQSTYTLNNNERLGNSAVYCFLYPNIMINRYGPWLDFNIVYPINENKCIILFEWFVDKAYSSDEKFIQDSIEQSQRVQIEDIELCNNVNIGLQSDAYESGRYVAAKEKAAYQFHKDIYSDIIK